MKVLNMGSLNLDYVYSVSHMVEKGETLSSHDMQIFCGGKGLNQSIALAKAGAEVYHAGNFGDDGEILKTTCEKYKVNTKYMKQLNAKSGHAIIQVDNNADNCILLYGGTNQMFTKEYIDEVLADFESDDILLLQNEINEMSYIIETAYKKGMKIVLNPSPFNEALQECDLTKISCFILNEIEGNQMCGNKDNENVLEGLHAQFPEAQIVLTLGSEGVQYIDATEFYEQSIYKVKAVDTTAAGDTFTGYFIAGLVEALPIPQSLERCAKASAITVSRNGAAEAIPTLQEVVRLKKQ